VKPAGQIRSLPSTGNHVPGTPIYSVFSNYQWFPQGLVSPPKGTCASFVSVNSPRYFKFPARFFPPVFAAPVSPAHHYCVWEALVSRSCFPSSSPSFLRFCRSLRTNFLSFLQGKFFLREIHGGLCTPFSFPSTRHHVPSQVGPDRFPAARLS